MTECERLNSDNANLEGSENDCCWLKASDDHIGWRKSQPIQQSRALHFKAGAEKLIRATHSLSQVVIYQMVSLIFGKEPR